MSAKSSYQDLGKLLKESRIAANLTQQYVAEKLGYSTSQFVSNWERGISAPPLQHIKAIVKMYKVDRAELLQILLNIQKELLSHQYSIKKRRLTQLLQVAP